MYVGRIVEVGATRKVSGQPQHPYTRALSATIPTPHPDRPEKTIPIKGGIPSAIDLPSGCPFHPRCPYVMDVCPTRMPPPVEVGGVSVRCFLHGGAEEIGEAAD